MSWIIQQVNETLSEAASASSKTESAGVIKPKSTPEGMMTAYVSLVIMALIPIVVGAFKSVKAHNNQKEQSKVRDSSSFNARR